MRISCFWEDCWFTTFATDLRNARSNFGLKLAKTVLDTRKLLKLVLVET